MSYVLMAYGIVLAATIGFGLREWYSVRCLEKQCHPRVSSKNETQA